MCAPFFIWQRTRQLAARRHSRRRRRIRRRIRRRRRRRRRSKVEEGTQAGVQRRSAQVRGFPRLSPLSNFNVISVSRLVRLRRERRAPCDPEPSPSTNRESESAKEIKARLGRLLHKLLRKACTFFVVERGACLTSHHNRLGHQTRK